MHYNNYITETENNETKGNKKPVQGDLEQFLC